MCLFDPQMLEGVKAQRIPWVEPEESSVSGPPGLHHPWDMLGDMEKDVWTGGDTIDCPVSLQSQHQAGPYLGPAADEQVQHILTDLVIVFIQKLVNLANSKTSW